MSLKKVTDQMISEVYNLLAQIDSPEDIKISEPEKGQITGKVESIIFKGVHYEIVVTSEGFDWKIHSTLYEEPGREVGLSVIPDDIHIMHKMTEETK